MMSQDSVWSHKKRELNSALYQLTHIMRNRRLKRQLFHCEGMKKRQRLTVERLPIDEAAGSSVQRITAQRISDMTHVNSDLMGSPGFQTDGDIRHTAEAPVHPKMRHRFLPVGDHRTLDDAR